MPGPGTWYYATRAHVAMSSCWSEERLPFSAATASPGAAPAVSGHHSPSSHHTGQPPRLAFLEGRRQVHFTPGKTLAATQTQAMNKLFFFFFFLGLQPGHMVVPRLGVQSELKPLATATQDLSSICDLHHNSGSLTH